MPHLLIHTSLSPMRMLGVLLCLAACEEHEPRAAPPPVDRAGAPAVPDPLGRGAWFVDDENDAVLFASSTDGISESPCAWPSQLVASSGGAVYAACRAEGLVRRISEPRAEWSVGPEPRSLALDEAAHRLYVGLATANEVLMLDADDGRVLARAGTAAEPTALALFAGGLAVGSRKSDRIDIYPRDLSRPPDPVQLALDQHRDVIVRSISVAQLVPARGALVVIAPVATLGRVEEPSYYSGFRGSPIEQQLFVLRSAGSQVLRAQRTFATPDVVSAAFIDQAFTGGLLLVASRGASTVAAIELEVRPESPPQTTKEQIPTLGKLAPGLAGFTDDGERSFFFVESERTVHVTASHGKEIAKKLHRPSYPHERAAAEVAATMLPAPVSRLSAELARGRQLFHQANDPRVAATPLACASCHVDGRDDGRTWAGQRSLRQTPMLAGRDIAHTAPFGWSGSYDTLEKYINFTITTRMRGQGLPEVDLSALALYVAHGLREVDRPAPPRLSASVARGGVLFESQGCASCHPADSAYTDGTRHDVASFAAAERAAQEADAKLRFELFVRREPRVPPLGPAPLDPALLAFDTPSLLRVSLTAPYLHDGSAQTLDDVFDRLGDHMGEVTMLSSADRDSLMAYLKTL